MRCNFRYMFYHKCPQILTVFFKIIKAELHSLSSGHPMAGSQAHYSTNNITTHYKREGLMQYCFHEAFQEYHYKTYYNKMEWIE